MRRLIKRRRIVLLTILLAAFVAAAWLYWNRPRRADLAVYAPADCLVFIESDDLSNLLTGIDHTEAWQSLADPLGAPQALVPNRWLLRFAKWTGIGSAETILFARSQVAIVLSGAEASQTESSLTIKPLATFIIETHTSQSRMKAPLERHIEELARRVYKNPGLLRKQVDGVDLEEWISEDKSHQIVIAFVDTTAILGNDESSVLHSIEAHNGKRASLRDANDFAAARNSSDSLASVFGFVSPAGVKSLLQAYAISRGGSSADAITPARLFADTFGGLVKSISWTTRFADGMVEDRCQIALPQGLADKLRAGMVPERGVDFTMLRYVPADAYTFSTYQLRDPTTFWNDLNTAVSSNTDFVGSVAARPILRGLLKPYGIDDPDAFARTVGPHLQTVRFDESSPSVLIVQTFDRQALKNLMLKRLGQPLKTEQVQNAEMLTSSSGDFSAAFVDNCALLGPTEAVRRCLAPAAPITSKESFRRARQVIDVARPFTIVSFTTDQREGISFVETFSNRERSAFSANAAGVVQVADKLPFALSVTLLKDSTIEWTSRSSFGIAGSLVAQFAPEK